MSITSTIIFAALIVASSSTISTLFLAVHNTREGRAKRLEEYARQNALADKAAQQVQALIETNVLITKRADETAIVLEGKLDVIHTLVNSSMTAVKQSEYDAVGRELALMREVMILKAAAGNPAAPEDHEAIALTQAKLEKLGIELSGRRIKDETARTQSLEIADRRERDEGRLDPCLR